MAYVPKGTDVRVTKGTATGCYGTVQASVWLPSGHTYYGIELTEPMGLNDGRFKDGTPYFHCRPYHGMYLKLDSFEPAEGEEEEKKELMDPLHAERQQGYEGDRKRFTGYGPDRLGLRRHGAGVKDPALVPHPDHKWTKVVGTMGNSFVEAYQPGDWHNMHAEASTESKQWAARTQELAHQLHAKEIELQDLEQELELTKIKHKWKDAGPLERQVAMYKSEVAQLNRAQRNLHDHKTNLADLRAAEDHRKPRSKPSSPATSPALMAGQPPSPLLNAVGTLDSSSFEGAKTLLPDQGARKPRFDSIKVHPKWDREETFSNVRTF